MNVIRSKRILLVEDHQFIINVIQDLLRSSGFKYVEKAGNAEYALKMMESNRYDMVITDVEMGEINGIELLKMIRSGKTPQPPSTRVIILTSHANMDVLGAAIALDVNGFLVKPAKLDTTVEKIKVAFEERFTPKKPIGYNMVNTAVIDKPEEEKPEEKNEMDREDAIIGAGGKEAKTECIMLMELTEGMVAAEAVKTKKGVAVIPAGHTLSNANINRLIEMKNDMEHDYVRILVN